MASPSFFARPPTFSRSSTRKYALFATLGLRRTQVGSPVQLSILPVYPARRFSVSGFFVFERTVAHMYSSNILDGLIIDLGYHWTGRMFLQFVTASC